MPRPAMTLPLRLCRCRERVDPLLPGGRRVQAEGPEITEVLADPGFHLGDPLRHGGRGAVEQPGHDPLLGRIVLPEPDDPAAVQDGVVREIGLQRERSQRRSCAGLPRRAGPPRCGAAGTGSPFRRAAGSVPPPAPRSAARRSTSVGQHPQRVAPGLGQRGGHLDGADGGERRLALRHGEPREPLRLFEGGSAGPAQVAADQLGARVVVVEVAGRQVPRARRRSAAGPGARSPGPGGSGRPTAGSPGRWAAWWWRPSSCLPRRGCARNRRARP